MKAVQTGMRVRGTIGHLALGVSALAIASVTGGPAMAQTRADTDLQEHQKPDADAGGTISSQTDIETATSPVVQGAAGSVSGTPGGDGELVAPPDVDRSEIVVTGVRQSLESAQQIKRDADTFVDAITAQDIGALPDRSVNEALQRVPGVTISRFAAPNDSQHFSAQGSGVVVRGLNYVRGELNGRDAFAVGGGREIGFNDIPSEIVGSIEVFKNLTADLIEGGISGTVNINTRKPFDTATDLLFVSGSINYGDLEERSSPSAVGLISKQFDLADGGRIGVLGSVAYSQFRTRADSSFTSSYLPRFNDDLNGNGVQDAGEGRTINAGTAFEASVFDTYPVPSGFDRVYVPLGGGNRTQSFDRERLAFVGSLQYENAARNFLATAQFTRAKSIESWLERTIEPNVYYGDVTTIFPVGSTAPVYDDNGVFLSGILGKNTGPVQGNRPDGSYGPLNQFVGNSIFNTLSNRNFYTNSIVQDYSLNIKWSPTDRLYLNFDGQYATSEVENVDDILDVGTFAQIDVDVTGDIARVSPFAPDRDINAYFANANSLYFRDAFNNRAINDGEEYAVRADAEYDFGEDSFLRSAKVGGRYAKREQTVRTNDYNNWGYLSEVWAATGPVSLSALQPNEISGFTYDNFLRGDAPQPPSTFYISPSVISNHDDFMDTLRRITAQGGGSYTPIEDRVRADGEPLIKGYFLPSEIYDNSEETFAAYARLDFGMDSIGGSDLRLAGNIGLRYVRTIDESVGALTFPRFDQIVPPSTANPPLYDNTIASFCAYQFSRPQTGTPPPPICTVSAEQQAAIAAFSNGATLPDTARQKFNNWLPSLNLKLGVTPELLFRFAASRAISRPNFGDLRNYVGLVPSGANTSGSFSFQAQSRNPFLKPVKATQFDLSAEWYFARVGSLTGTVFYKELTDIILDNAGYTRTVSNGGQSFDIAVNGPANVTGKGKIKGAEVAYQQTFDFLPGELSGLGVQATYTFVDASDIPNGTPANGAADGARPPSDVTGIYDNLPLQGLSKHTFNLAGFYDRGSIYARLAYNWRSKYLLTQRDCCFPFLPVYGLPNGTLDGSIFLTVSPNFKIGLEAQNLLDTVTKTTFVINSDGLEAPRSFFKTDRSFSLSTRLTF